jgi:hypothetical protein
MANKYRLHLTFSKSGFTRLTEAAHSQGLLPAELVRRALNIEDFLRGKQNAGAVILVQHVDGSTHQLIIS